MPPARAFLRILLALALLAPRLSRANMAAPPKPHTGDIAGSNVLRSLSVLREDLRLDLTPLAENHPAAIFARYVIESPRALHDVELLFIACGLDENPYHVTLDGHPLPGRLVSYDSIPEVWKSPKHRNDANNGQQQDYSLPGIISFRGSLTAGRHIITVNYQASASEDFDPKGQILTRTQGVDYILKPTEDWHSFDHLHLAVRVPDGWSIATNLPLPTDSAGYHTGYWPKLPATQLHITTQKSATPARTTVRLLMAGQWLLLLGGIYWWLRHSRRQSWAVALGATLFYFVLDVIEDGVLSNMLGSEMNRQISYDKGYYLLTDILYFPFVWLALTMVLFSISSAIDFIVRRRKAKSGGHAE